MSKIDIIRSLPHLSDSEVAKIAGTTANRVHVSRWADRNPERRREHQRAIYRRQSANFLPGIKGGVWQPEHDFELIRMLAKGKSYSQIGAYLQVNRNCVAGRVSRLREAGRIK